MDDNTAEPRKKALSGKMRGRRNQSVQGRRLIVKFENNPFYFKEYPCFSRFVTKMGMSGTKPEIAPSDFYLYT